MRNTGKRVHLICWKDDRAAGLRGRLEEAGWSVDTKPFQMSTLKMLAASPPDAVVVDLGRLPSQGRDVGVALRTRAGTRNIPIVFVDGGEEKIARTRELLPDAAYLKSAELAAALPGALAEAPAEPTWVKEGVDWSQYNKFLVMPLNIDIENDQFPLLQCLPYRLQ